MSHSDEITAELLCNGKKIVKVLGLVSTTDERAVLQLGQKNPLDAFELKRLILGPMDPKDTRVGFGSYTVVVDDVEKPVSLVGEFIQTALGHEIDVEIVEA